MWRRRQRTAYENMWRDAARQRKREQFVAGPFGWVVEGPSSPVVAVVVVVLIVFLAAFAASRALAVEWREYRVPKACESLAQQNGIPDMLTAADAAKVIAKLNAKMWWPGVSQCRQAIHREWRL